VTTPEDRPEPERLTATEARVRLTELVNLAGFQGKRFLITMHGKPIAAIVGAAELEQKEEP
jgi:prevent-host-death family protein